MSKNQNSPYRIECTLCNFMVQLTKEQYKDVNLSKKIMADAIAKHKLAKEYLGDTCPVGKLYFNAL